MKALIVLSVIAVASMTAATSNASTSCVDLFASQNQPAQGKLKAHIDFLKETNSRQAAFPHPKGYVEIGEVKSSDFTKNDRGNLEKKTKNSTIELVDETNDVGFTSLRYSVVFNEIATVLGIGDFRSYSLSVVKVDGSKTVSALEIHNYKGYKYADNINEYLRMMDPSAIGEFHRRLIILKAISGVDIDIADMKPNISSNTFEMPIIVVENPNRILKGFSKPLGVLQLKDVTLSRDIKSKLDAILGSRYYLTTAEATELAKRLKAIGIITNGVDRLLPQELPPGIEKL